MDWELPPAGYLSDHLKAKRRRRRRKQQIWEPKEYTLEMIEPTTYPSRTNVLRAHQASLNNLQHLLQLPLHSQPHIQQHPHPKPLHLWLRVWALLVCLTPPIVWTHSRLRHLWQLQSANQWHPAPVTPVSVSLGRFAIPDDHHRAATGVDMTVCTAMQRSRLAIPYHHLAQPLWVAYGALSHVSRGSGRSSNKSLTRSEIREAL